MSNFLKNFSVGFNLYLKGFERINSWCFLGYQEILLKYRRSILGPWWATITVILLITLLSFLWSKIFGLQLKYYVPYFSIGYIIWIFFSNTISESCTLLVENANIIKQTNTLIIAFNIKLLIKNIILLLHNSTIIFFILFTYTDVNIFNILISFFSIIMLCIVLLNLSIIISILSAKFFDFSQLIINLTQLAFFLTPIIWEPSFLKDKIWVTDLNPIYHWFELIRQPLIGGDIPSGSFIVLFFSILLSFIIAIFSLGYSSKKIPLWL